MPSSAALPIQRKNPALVRPMSNGYSARRVPPLPPDDFALLETDAMVTSLCKTIRVAQPQSDWFSSLAIWHRPKRDRSV